MKSRTLGILWLVCATLFFMVQEFILALIFAALGVYALFGMKEQSKKQPAPVKKAAAPKKSTVQKQNPPAGKQNSLAGNQTPPSGVPAADAYAFRGSVEDYFLKLLQASFPEYQVEKNVAMNALHAGSPDSSGWKCECGYRNWGQFCVECGRKRPVENNWICSCGEHNTGKFCSDCGKPRPASKRSVQVPENSEPLTFLLRRSGAPNVGIILCGKYEWNTEAIHNTREACKKANIPCLRFMREFRNDAGYVTDRIRKVLR